MKISKHLMENLFQKRERETLKAMFNEFSPEGKLEQKAENV